MKKIIIIASSLLLLYGCSSVKQLDNNQSPGHYGEHTLLPNGWKLTPAGENIEIGELPLNMILTKDENYAVTSNSGTNLHSISVIDLENKKEIQRIIIDKTWRGLCFNKDESTLFVSGGNNDKIYSYNFKNGFLTLNDSLNLRSDENEIISVTGISYWHLKNYLLAVSKESNSVYFFDISGKKLIKTIKLKTQSYDIKVDHKERYAYVSQWGGASIAKINLSNFKLDKIIKVGDHPCEMIISKDDKWLYVTNANNNSTSLVDLEKGEEKEKIISSLRVDAPFGSTPNSAAFNEDETILFVANADNNYLALFDISSPGNAKSIGFIPVGWYPTAVRYSTKQNKIIVANGKGLTSKPNPLGPMPGVKSNNSIEQYIGSLFNGTLSIIDFPDVKKLAFYSKQVFQNTPYISNQPSVNDQSIISSTFDGVRSDKIRHVFYIIKENRTYDQVFGDLPNGNGDSTICLFPEDITPNQHRLANEFTLFDNFYVDAEVSADGHNWSTAAYASDYVEKTWPTYYGGRGGSYDFEGGSEIGSPSSGYIWDQVIDKGVGFRNYGEFTIKKADKENEYYGALDKLTPYTCELFPGWDLKIPDRERYRIWHQDFNHFIKIDSLPSFQIIRLPNNHTAGTKKGFPTVKAMIADNDYALGLVVEAISKSKFWKESIIFVLEDDAQNGSDHVDAHRSPLLVISPYVKRHFVDHTMYSTSSVLKTIELILGLEPMTQFDLSAAPILKPIKNNPDLKPYQAIKPGIDMDEINTASMYGSERSGEMDLSIEDAIPDIEFNEIIWKNIKGVDSHMPVPVRGAYLKVND